MDSHCIAMMVALATLMATLLAMSILEADALRMDMEITG